MSTYDIEETGLDGGEPAVRACRRWRSVTSGCTSAGWGIRRRNDIPMIVRGRRAATSGIIAASGTSTASRVSSRSQIGHGRTELAEAAAKTGRTARVLPIWTLRPPESHRARRPSSPASLRASSTGVLHRRRLRGGRVRMEARPPVLPGARPTTADQSHEPEHRVSRHDHGASFDHGRPAIRERLRAARPRCDQGPEHELLQSSRTSPTTQRPSGGGPPTRSTAPSSVKVPTPSRRSFSSRCRIRGCFPPPPGYFEGVREICDRHGVLLVSDEVICAFGRLGEWFGSHRTATSPT